MCRSGGHFFGLLSRVSPFGGRLESEVGEFNGDYLSIPVDRPLLVRALIYEIQPGPRVSRFPIASYDVIEANAMLRSTGNEMDPDIRSFLSPERKPTHKLVGRDADLGEGNPIE